MPIGTTLSVPRPVPVSPNSVFNAGALINAFAPRGRVHCTGGLDYGPGQRHRLDIYSPSPHPNGALRMAPVVVFFYGGGWEEGDRDFYRFVGAALAERGIVTVVPDYRLFPEIRFPGFLEDAAQAVGWVQAEIGDFGGDPGRVFLMGHSAGAYIAAMLALDATWLSGARAASLRPAPKLRGVIGLAGPYDFLPLHTEVLRAIFGPPETLWQTQPIEFVSPAAPPMFLAHGARDRIVLPRNSTRLSARLRAAGCIAETRLYPVIGHKLLIAGMARPLRFVAPVLHDSLDFIRRMDRSA